MKVATFDVEVANIALAPGGAETTDQLYVSGFPSASELPPPSRDTLVPTKTFCWAPAFATGAALQALTLAEQSWPDPPLPPQPTRTAATKPKQRRAFILTSRVNNFAIVHDWTPRFNNSLFSRPESALSCGLLKPCFNRWIRLTCGKFPLHTGFTMPAYTTFCNWSF